MIFLNEFAILEAVTVNNIGAFFDWGLDGKDLFVPYSEQHQELKEGESYLVYLYYDKQTDRLVGSTKKNRYLETEKVKLTLAEKVNILIYEETNLGYNVIINDLYQGLLYKNEIFEPVFIDDFIDAYVKKIRPDGKIDVHLYPIGYKAVEDQTKKLYKALIKNDKHLKVNDKTDSKIIHEQLGMSKKVFKKAAGALYKKKAITFTDDGIQLILELDEFK